MSRIPSRPGPSPRARLIFSVLAASDLEDLASLLVRGTSRAKVVADRCSPARDMRRASLQAPARPCADAAGCACMRGCSAAASCSRIGRFDLVPAAAAVRRASAWIVVKGPCPSPMPPNVSACFEFRHSISSYGCSEKNKLAKQQHVLGRNYASPELLVAAAAFLGGAAARRSSAPSMATGNGVERGRTNGLCSSWTELCTYILAARG